MKRILVVDDLAPVREVLRMYLERRGYEVFEAETGEEALTRTEETKPDLILMDLDLPKMNGLEATRRLRQQDRFKNVPIIAFSGNTTVRREELLEAGFNDYIEKSRVSVVADRIASLLSP